MVARLTDFGAVHAPESERESERVRNNVKCLRQRATSTKAHARTEAAAHPLSVRAGVGHVISIAWHAPLTNWLITSYIVRATYNTLATHSHVAFVKRARVLLARRPPKISSGNSRAQMFFVLATRPEPTPTNGFRQLLSLLKSAHVRAPTRSLCAGCTIIIFN